MDKTGKDSIVSTPSATSLWTKLGLMAASVAAIGAVLGAFYLGTVFSTKPPETKSLAAAETTGSASAQDKASREDALPNAAAPVEAADAANCQEQTWPYIARPCLANEKGERGVRMISTDKLSDPVINVVETPPEAVINRKVAQPEPSKAQAAMPAPAARVENNSAAVGLAPLKSGAALGAIAINPAAAAEPVAAVSPPPAEPTQTAAAPATSPQPEVQAMASVEPQAMPDKRAEKSKEKPKRKAAKRQEERSRDTERFNDSERSKVTTAQSDDDNDEPVVERRNGRIKGRVVERWTERDYTVPSHDGGGTRRVIVRSGNDRERDAYRERAVSTERGGEFPNFFGAIFGSN